MSTAPEQNNSMIGSATEGTEPPAAATGAVPDPTPPEGGQTQPSAADSTQPANEGTGVESEGGTEVEKGASVPPLTPDDLTLPEGYTLPEDLGGEFIDLFNNPPESKAEFANKMLSLHTNLLQKVADEHAHQWESLQEEWRTAVRELPQIGGENLDRSLGEIAKVLDKYGDKDAREALSVTGAGNHPALVRLFYNIAKDLNERPPVKGAPAVGEPRDRASRMYGNS